MDGMEIIREVREKRPATKAIVITGYPSISSAVDAMKLGVSDYLPKPFWDEDFKAAVEKALAGGKEMYLKQEPDITHARRAVRAARPIRESVKVEPLGRPRVLLMEDEPSLARGLKMVLSKQGYEVDLADTGVRALGSQASGHGRDGSDQGRERDKPANPGDRHHRVRFCPFRRRFHENRRPGLPGKTLHHG